ncbi:MAG: glycosyltransferase, partial [Gammaproteobacteria bacterium]
MSINIKSECKNSKFLFICHYDVNGLSEVIDHIHMIASNLSFYTDIINVQLDNNEYLMLSNSINLDNYVGVIIHPSVSYSPINLDHIDDNLHLKLKDFKGIKILIKQDEHVHTHYTARLIGEKKFDLVLTCLPENEIEKAYPLSLTGSVTYLQTYTSYVSPGLKTLKNKLWEERKIDIAYRGSIQP